MTLFQKISLVILLGFVFLFFAQKINLTTADVGRHIKNGEEVFKNSQVLFTNYYSYTEPDFKLINHHFLFGVFSYILWVLGGFKFLSFSYALLNTLTFLVFFLCAKRFSNFNIAFLFGILLIPLIASRIEVRPEGLSYFIFGVFLYQLLLFRDKKISFKRLLIILTAFQVIWVNSHIFFIFGVFLSLLFIFEAFILKRGNIKLLKSYLTLTISLFFASLINFFTIQGFLEPFNVFKEYGYMIVENQSVVFMQKRFSDPIFLFFEISFFLTLFFLLFLVISVKSYKKMIILPLLFLCFGVLAWRLNRMLALYGLILIPAGSYILYEILKKFKKENYNLTTFTAVFAIFIFFISIIPNHLFSPFKGRTGLGLMNEVEASANFFKENNIKGPIFNNYDIGGYLIFNLFPKEKVFVDNRPEAYSISFFTKIYIPMQEDDKVWKEVDSRYNFNAIYFYRYDMTPWAQPFLIERVRDSSWIPIFVDDYTIIFVRNSTENKALIDKYEIPKEMFGQN